MRLAFILLNLGVFIFLLLPLAIVVLISFSDGTGMEFPPTNLSLQWYAKALESSLFRQALFNSVVIGLLAAMISTLIGLGAAFAIARARFRGKSTLEAILLSPLVVPGIVLGIALLAAFSAIDLGTAWERLILAHILLTFPFCVRTILASLARLDRTCEEAAATLGATSFQVFTYVTFPMIRPGVIAGGLFAFVISFDNVPISIFLVDTNTTTIPIAIISYLEWNFDPSVAAVSSLLIITMLVLALVLERLTGLRKVLGGRSG